MKYDCSDIEICISNEEIELLKSIRIFTSEMPLFQESLFHYRIGMYVNMLNISGDFVECGVYNGHSAASISVAFKNRTDCNVWLYDSFEGFPESNSVKDGNYCEKLKGHVVGSVDAVLYKMKLSGFNSENIILKKGWFNDTFKEEKPDKISILHIDCDFYDSVKITLETFYDIVSEGGIILIDDFGAFSGCRTAFYEFCEKRQIRPLLRSYDHTRVFFVKTGILESEIDGTMKMHNNWLNYIKLIKFMP